MCFGTGGEGSGLLVAHMHPLDLALSAQRISDAVQAVTNYTVNPSHAHCSESLGNLICYGSTHDFYMDAFLSDPLGHPRLDITGICTRINVRRSVDHLLVRLIDPPVDFLREIVAIWLGALLVPSTFSVAPNLYPNCGGSLRKGSSGRYESVAEYNEIPCEIFSDARLPARV